MATCLSNSQKRRQEQKSASSISTPTPDETRVGLAFKQPVSGFWKRPARSPRSEDLSRHRQSTDPQGPSVCPERLHRRLSEDGARLDGIGLSNFSGPDHRIRRLWRRPVSVSFGLARSAPRIQSGRRRPAIRKKYLGVELPEPRSRPSQSPRLPRNKRIPARSPICPGAYLLLWDTDTGSGKSRAPAEVST